MTATTSTPPNSTGETITPPPQSLESAAPAKADAAPATTPSPDPVEGIKETLASNERFWSRITGKRGTEKAPDTKPPETADAGATPPEAGETPPRKAKTRKPARPEAEPDNAPDPTKLAEIQGRETGREMGRIIAETLKPKEPERKEAAEPQLPEEYQADVDVYRMMEKMFPDKYGEKSGKPLTARLVEAAKREDEYIKSWQQEHPDEDFDGDAEEHNAFYKRQFPEINERDFRAADRATIEQQSEERASRRANKVVDEFRAEQREREIKPAIVAATFDVVKAALAAVDEKEYANLDPLGIDALADKDPVAARLASSVYAAYQPVVAANLEVHRGIKPFDSKNPAHVGLFRVANTIEQRVLALDPKDRFDDQGRYFATRYEWEAMTPENRQRHWFVDEDAISYALAADARAEAEKAYAQTRKDAEFLAPKLGFSKPPASKPTQNGTQPEDGKHQETPRPAKSTPNSPSVSVKASVGAPASSDGASNKSGQDIFFSRLIGR